MLGVIKKNVQPGDLGVQVLSWENPSTSRGGQYDYTYCEDIHSRTVNISLDRDLIPDPDTGFDSANYEGIFWTISWLAGNAGQTVDVDVQNGTYVTVLGRNVNVQISYPVIPGSQQKQLPIDARAVLGFEGGHPVAGLASIARRTVRIGTVAAGAVTPFFRVPRFAVAAVIRNSVLSIPTMVIGQARGSNGGLINVSMVGKLEQDVISICDGASFFSIENTSANNANDVSVVFYLGI
jgi:hypothetical protein